MVVKWRNGMATQARGLAGCQTELGLGCPQDFCRSAEGNESGGSSDAVKFGNRQAPRRLDTMENNEFKFRPPIRNPAQMKLNSVFLRSLRTLQSFGAPLPHRQRGRLASAEQFPARDLDCGHGRRLQPVLHPVAAGTAEVETGTGVGRRRRHRRMAQLPPPRK